MPSSTDEGAYTVASTVDVTFELAEARDYTLRYHLERVTQNDGVTRVSLGTAENEGSVFEPALDFSGGEATGALDGRLAAGRYRFVFLHVLGGDASAIGPYSVELARSAAPVPIPLPPAALPFAATASAALLLRLAGNRRWRRRGARFSC